MNEMILTTLHNMTATIDLLHGRIKRLENEVSGMRTDPEKDEIIKNLQNQCEIYAAQITDLLEDRKRLEAEVDRQGKVIAMYINLLNDASLRKVGRK